jgi:hypothetical protein
MVHRDLVIGEDGLVYPCCGFFSMKDHRKMAVGDPITQVWHTIKKKSTEPGLKKERFFTPCIQCIKKQEK